MDQEQMIHQAHVFMFAQVMCFRCTVAADRLAGLHATTVIQTYSASTFLSSKALQDNICISWNVHRLKRVTFENTGGD